MEVKSLFLERGRFVVQDGTQTRFWEDLWLGKEPLRLTYPSLYNIVRKKNATVAQVLSTSPLNVSFRRAVVGENWNRWLILVGSLMNVQLSANRDLFVWTKSKTFSVHAMYNDLMLGEGVPFDISSWKVKIPLKIKIFLWFLRRGVLLTKDNLAKRKWKGGTDCCFCNMQETIQHLFFDCPLARLVWGIVCITFDIRIPMSVEDVFGSWIRDFPFKQRNRVLLGVAAVCWAIWLSRNDMVFQRTRPNSCLQVIFRGGVLDQELVNLIKRGRERQLDAWMPQPGDDGSGCLRQIRLEYL
jgi:hypothetical protein